MTWPDKAVKWKRTRIGELKGLDSKSMVVKSYTHIGDEPNAG